MLFLVSAFFLKKDAFCIAEENGGKGKSICGPDETHIFHGLVSSSAAFSIPQGHCSAFH